MISALFVSQVAAHAALIGIGPDRCRQSPRQPNDEALVQRISGTDGGMTNLQGVRCVSNYNGSTIDKISNWCKNTGDYTGTTADHGYCFGTTPNTYTSDAHSGLPDSAPFLWGNDKGCDWNAGEDIRVSIHVTAQHKGSHFVDFVPQNEAQLEGLPLCPGSKDANGNVAPFKKDRINDFEVCVHDHVHYADGNGEDIPAWQRKSIRLHPAFALVGEQEATNDPNYNMKFYATTGTGAPTSVSNYRIDYKFKLPNLNYDASKPAVFRWVWLCGYDAQCDCTPANASWMHPNVTTGETCPANDYVGYGLGEIFINCADVARVSGSDSPLPTTEAPVTTEAPTTDAPTTAAPTTEAPVTTAAPETTEELHPCNPVVV
jgi:hypothetical protein